MEASRLLLAARVRWTCPCPVVEVEMGTVPDVERSLLTGAQRARAGADAAVHHLLPEVVDLGLEAAILCSNTHTQNSTTDSVCSSLHTHSLREAVRLGFASESLRNQSLLRYHRSKSVVHSPLITLQINPHTISPCDMQKLCSDL